MTFYANLGPFIVAQLQESVGRHLTAGSVDYRTPGVLRLRQVRVRQGDSLRSPTLVEALGRSCASTR